MKINNKITTLALSLMTASALWGQSTQSQRRSTETTDTAVGQYSDSLGEEGYVHGVNLGAGFSSGQPVLAADYEYRLSHNFGIGAYGAYSSKKGTTQPGIGALGASFKAHVAIRSTDFYVRPGLGVTYFDHGNDRVAFVSPSLAFGLVIRVAKNVAVGMEHLQLFNWSSDDQPAKAEALLATVQFRF
jgi:hypothetical protein